jgi:hypothetical protein
MLFVDTVSQIHPPVALFAIANPLIFGSRPMNSLSCMKDSSFLVAVSDSMMSESFIGTASP